MTLWFQQPFRFFKTNIREIDAVMDVNQVLDDLKRSMPTPGCSIQPVLHHFTLCTAVSDAQPVAGRTTRRRLAGRCCHRAHKHGVRVISRFDWSKLPPGCMSTSGLVLRQCEASAGV